MSPLANWTASEAVTDTTFNEMVNDVPSSLPIVTTPRDTPFEGKAGVTSYEVGRMRLAPIQGRYLHIRHEMKSSDGASAVATYKLSHPGGVVDLFASGSITSTSYAAARETIDMEALTFPSGEVLDVTGDEATLILYLNEKAVVRMIQVYTGDGSADADYGGT